MSAALVFVAWASLGTAAVSPARAQTLPTVTISAGPSPVGEGGPAIFTVTLSNAAPAGGLTVNLSVSEEVGSDYVASTNEGAKTVSFAEGQTRKRYIVPTVNDENDETNASVTVTLTSGDGYTLGATTSAAVTVNDNDLPAVPNLSVTPVTGEMDQLDVSWDAVTGLAYDSYSVRWKTGNQTYGPGREIVKNVNDPNSTTARIDGLRGDTAYDVEVSALWSVIDRAVAASEVRGTKTNALTVAISAESSSVTEGQAAVFIVTLSNKAPAGGVAVKATVSEAAGSDYVASTNEGAKTMWFTEGFRHDIYFVHTVDDRKDETNGSVTVTLTSGDGYRLGATTSATVTVYDNDLPAVPNLSVTPVAGATDQLDVSWDAVTGLAYDSYSVRWKTGNQTYGPDREIVKNVNDPNSTTARIDGLRGDTAYDVEVSAFGTTTVAVSEVGGTRTSAPIATATISAETSPVTEGNPAVFIVTLSNAAAPVGGLTINAMVSEAAGSDYVTSDNEGAKTISIAEGWTRWTYVVPTVDDGNDETNGSVTVTLTSGDGYTPGEAASASVTVNDNDGGGNTGGDAGGGDTGGDAGGGDTGSIAPAAPQFFRAVPRDGFVLLSWQDADAQGGPAISHYACRYGAGLNLFDPWQDIPESAPGEANANRYTVPDTLKGGTLYTFQVRAVNEEGTHGNAISAVVFLPSSTNTEDTELPDAVMLFTAFPNPFNPQTRIDYALPSAVHVRLAVYDVQGRRVRLLENGVRPAGRHTAVFDAADLPGGVYVYRLETPEGIVSKAATLMK